MPTANTYTYDEADRLTSWNNGTTTTNYAYDGDGNLTQAGQYTYTFDARDEETSITCAGCTTTTMSYTANGALSCPQGRSGSYNPTQRCLRPGSQHLRPGRRPTTRSAA